jgi:hypothetical protein
MTHRPSSRPSLREACSSLTLSASPMMTMVFAGIDRICSSVMS